MQTIIVGVVIVLAAAFLVRQAVKTFKNKKNGCSGCGCTKNQDKVLRAIDLTQ